MSGGWHGYDGGSGSGAAHEPSEERGHAAWSSGEVNGAGAPPAWSSAETQAALNSPWASGSTAPPPPWATAETSTSAVLPYASGGSAGGLTGAPYAFGSVGVSYPSAGAAPHGFRRVVVAVLVAVLVGVAVGVGVWFLIRDTSGGHGTGAGPVVGGAATGTGSSAPATRTGPSATATTPRPTGSGTAITPSARSSQDGAASGYRRTQDPVGYTIDVPDGWTRTEKQGQLAPVVSFDAPEDGRRLQVFRLAEDSPAGSLDLAENAPGYGFSGQPGYRVLDRTSGTGWAELAYRYDDSGLGPRQVIDHRFEAADGTLYAIRSTGPESLDPTLLRTPLTRALTSFCPTGTECA